MPFRKDNLASQRQHDGNIGVGPNCNPFDAVSRAIEDRCEPAKN